MGLRLTASEDGFDLLLGGRKLLAHGSEKPAFFLGEGNPDIRMVRGNFQMSDRAVQAPDLLLLQSNGDDQFELSSVDGSAILGGRFDRAAGRLIVRARSRHNRVTLDMAIEPDEVLWGGEYLVKEGQNVHVVVTSTVNQKTSTRYGKILLTHMR